jgi:membrane-bound lytic murein transglycosylase D
VAPEAAPSVHRVLYTVRRGDTLITISDRFGVSLADLRRWNHVTGTRVDPGRRLHIAEPAPVEQASGSRKRYSSAASETTRTRSSGAATPAGKKTAPSSRKRHSKAAKTASQEKSSSPHKSNEMAKASQQK